MHFNILGQSVWVGTFIHEHWSCARHLADDKDTACPLQEHMHSLEKRISTPKLVGQDIRQKQPAQAPGGHGEEASDWDQWSQGELHTRNLRGRASVSRGSGKNQNESAFGVLKYEKYKNLPPQTGNKLCKWLFPSIHFYYSYASDNFIHGSDPDICECCGLTPKGTDVRGEP